MAVVLLKDGQLHGEGSGSRHPQLRFYYAQDANNRDGLARLNIKKKYVCMKATAYIQPHMVEGELVSAPLPANWTITGYRYCLDDQQGMITTSLNRPDAPKPPDLAHTGLDFPNLPCHIYGGTWQFKLVRLKTQGQRHSCRVWLDR